MFENSLGGWTRYFSQWSLGASKSLARQNSSTSSAIMPASCMWEKVTFCLRPESQPANPYTASEADNSIFIFYNFIIFGDCQGICLGSGLTTGGNVKAPYRVNHMKCPGFAGVTPRVICPPEYGIW